MQMDLAIPMGACILGIIKVHETTLTITNGLQGLPNQLIIRQQPKGFGKCYSQVAG